MRYTDNVLQDTDKLENRYKILYPVFGILRDAFSYPCQVTDFLLLQLYVTIEHPILELLQEGLFVELHFHMKKLVFELCCDSCIIIALPTCGVEERPILHHAITCRSYVINFVCPCQLVISRREKSPDVREQLCTLFFREFCVERIDRNVDGTPVCFEREYTMHYVGCWWAKRRTESVEIFKVGFVHGVTDDLNVQIVQVSSREAFTEVRS